MKFRKLRADEIDVRVQSVYEKGAILLLYKDARCDMNILDETVGALNWKREHTRENANCIVSIWDETKKQWVSKEDTGTESFTEKEKGLASDSFKRACFNWGIGRELYTAPFIWVELNSNEVSREGNRYKLNSGVKFSVKEITYVENSIKDLVIIDNKGDVRFTNKKGSKVSTPKEKGQEQPLFATSQQIHEIGKLYAPEVILEKILPFYKIESLKEMKYDDAIIVIKNGKRKK